MGPLPQMIHISSIVSFASVFNFVHPTHKNITHLKLLLFC